MLILLGIDRAIAYTLLGRGWGVLSGLITLWFISRYLAPAEQGFYYTFASVLALQVLFELGLSYVVMQFASHEMAHLSWSVDGKLEGNAKAKSRLRSLLVLVVKWYGAISLLIVIGILPAGWIFFTMNGHNANVSWQLAWFWLVLVAALNIFVIPIFAVLEGCGRVAEVARMRMMQGISGSIIAWLAFVSGGRLLAMPVMNTAMVIVALIWTWRGYSVFFKDILSAHLHDINISWKTEIWPMQWRVALSWLSGYFIFQLFVPVLFAYRGPAEAGKMGMSLSIAMALSTLAIAWVNTKAPVFGNLVALKRYLELDILFFRVLSQSLVVVILGSLVLLIGYWFLQKTGSSIHERILPILPFVLLICTVVVNQIVFAEAAYLRSHKEEPFMWLSIVVGLLIAASTFFIGKQYGSTGMMLGYFTVSLFVSLGWGTWIFFTKRKIWHRNENGKLH
jgi:hypothetical protein